MVVIVSGGTKSDMPLKVYGKLLPVSADCVTMPEKASIARRPLASSFSWYLPREQGAARRRLMR